MLDVRATATGEVRALIVHTNRLALVDVADRRTLWTWYARPEGCLVAIPGDDVGTAPRAELVSLPGGDCTWTIDQLVALATQLPGAAYSVVPCWMGACLVGSEQAFARLVLVGSARRDEQLLRLGPGASVHALLREPPSDGYAGTRCQAPVAADEDGHVVVMSDGSTRRADDGAVLGRCAAHQPGLAILRGGRVALVPRRRPNAVEVYSTAGRLEGTAHRHGGSVIAMALSRTGRRLVTCAADAWLRTWELSVPEGPDAGDAVVGELPLSAHIQLTGAVVTAVAFLRDGAVLVGREDGRVSAVTLDREAVERQVARIDGPVAGISIAGDGGEAFAWSAASTVITTLSLGSW